VLASVAVADCRGGGSGRDAAASGVGGGS
jgi:hypothetical protein